MRAFCLLAMLVIGAGARGQDVPHYKCFDIASRHHQVPLDLLLAVAAVESGWDADARSDRDAHGVMQIRWPVTARHLGVGRVAELYNPCLNIDLGARYLREMLDRYDEDETLALAAYNYGPSRLGDRDEIPTRVLGYVRRVDERRQAIASRLAARTVIGVGKGSDVAGARLQLAHFDEARRAERFVEALTRQVPSGAPGLAIEGTAVYLYPDRLDADARYRLSMLIPALVHQEVAP